MEFEKTDCGESEGERDWEPARGEAGRAGGAAGRRRGRGGLGSRRRTLLPAARPAAPGPAAAFLRVSHTLAIKEPKAPAFPRPSPARARAAIFHPLPVFNLLWGKKAAFVGRGAARGARRGRRDCVSRSCAPGAAGGGGRRGAGRGRGRPGGSCRAGVGASRARGAGGEGRVG